MAAFWRQENNFVLFFSFLIPFPIYMESQKILPFWKFSRTNGPDILGPVWTSCTTNLDHLAPLKPLRITSEHFGLFGLLRTTGRVIFWDTFLLDVHIIIELCCCFSSCCWAPQLVELVTLLGKQHRLSCNVFLTLAMAFLLFYSCTISCNVFSTILLLCCISYSCTIFCHVFCYTGVTPLMSSVRLTSAADSSNTSC